MKLLLVCLCSYIGLCVSVLAEGVPPKPPKMKNFLDEVVLAESIYVMSEKDIWTCVAGNLLHGDKPNYSLSMLLPAKMDVAKLKLNKDDFLKQMQEKGNVYFYFNRRGVSSGYFSMNAYKVKWDFWIQEGKLNDIYPKVASLPSDLLWLSKNQFLLRKLRAGNLTTKEYRFSDHEFTLLVRFSSEAWREKLVKYALSDLDAEHQSYTGASLAHHYLNLLLKRQSNGKKIEKNFPYFEGIDTVQIFYSSLLKNAQFSMADSVRAEYKNVLLKLEKGEVLSPSEFILTEAALLDKELNIQFFRNYNELSLLRKYIIKQKDEALLAAYMKRIERRQSVADIPVLGQFLQSDFFKKANLEVRTLILDQCALRKEKAIVWQLADSVGLALPKDDRPLQEEIIKKTRNRARTIMMKFTAKDLGDDPEAWKKWYREQ